MKRSIQRVAARERKRRKQKEQSRRGETTTESGTVLPVVAIATTTTIDDCLAELESSLLLLPPPPPPPTTTAAGDRQQKEQATDDSIDRNDDASKRPSDVAQKLPRRQQHHYCTINAAMIRDKMEIWNETFRAWQKAALLQKHNKGQPPPAGLVPNFDVEMARHFKVQELSTFLLEASMVVVGDSTTGLKMPAFERWLLDAKLEDQTKWRSMMMGKSQDATLSSHDPVLPKEAHIGMEASKRLVEELIECSAKARLDARHLVKDLCRRSNAAYQHIQQLQRAMAARTGLWKRGDRVEMKISSSSSSLLPERESNGHDKKDDRKTTTTTTAAAAGNVVVVTLTYHRPKQWKKPFCVKLNQSHYDKLKIAFLRVHNNNTSQHRQPALPNFRDDDDDNRSDDAGAALASTFHLLLMTMLLRYSSLSGGHLLQDLRGGGMQGAVHEEVFQVLASSSSGGGDCIDDDDNNVVTVCLEGFASPFNCYWPAFGSAFFHDLDWHFGGVGNFFDLPLAAHAAASAASSNDNTTHTIVQANPPFTPGVMSNVTAHILRQVNLADAMNIALTFVVICATPGDPRDPNLAVAKRYGGDAVRPLLRLPNDKEEEEEEDANTVVPSPLSHHIVLTAREHGYVEGAQHLRPTRYKESPYDTSVIIVSSRRAGTMLLDSNLESLEQRLRVAFASRHRQETAARRPKDKTSCGE